MSDIILYDSKTLDILKSDEVNTFVTKALHDKSKAFMTSLITIVSSSTELQKCTATSVLGAALKAASLNLPIDNGIGLAYVIPYAGSATFQMSYKGYIQLAMRSGQYRKIVVTDVKVGELLEADYFSETYRFCQIPDETKRESANACGYYAMFEMLNGYKKEMYWSIERIKSHAKKYSKSYMKSDSPWQKNFDEMCKKTMIKQLISKWGIMSIDMQTSINADMATVDVDITSGTESIQYHNDTIDITPETIIDPAEEAFNNRD